MPKITEIGKLMERMYKLWKIRARSEKEIRDYFRIKNQEYRIKGKIQASDLIVELVIKKLKQINLLNDLEFAKAWVDARSKKKGMRVIKGELFKKGISKEIIDEVTDIELNQENTAKRLLERRLSRIHSRKQAYEFLLRRGFEYELVKVVVEKLLKKKYTTL